ncbi:hypothetical protein DERF_014775 [Dermatophagoides farinae]|uniref:Uncharacterized protein n=1 Tax=Dermatophagoides farinae TaxID=6954 RepID=A0A922HJJ3_DERFA|nr:hypothetical protein DERF_014775 [Dermatophagoides farinae]
MFQDEGLKIDRSGSSGISHLIRAVVSVTSGKVTFDGGPATLPFLSIAYRTLKPWIIPLRSYSATSSQSTTMVVDEVDLTWTE